MNNSPLRLAEGLRAIGRDVHLFVTRKEILHRPESVYPQLNHSKYPSWMHDVSDAVGEYGTLLDPAMKDDLIQWINREFGLSILNDWAVSLAKDLTHPHLAMLTGSDVSYYANFETLANFASSWDPLYKRSGFGREAICNLIDLIKQQRDGIASSLLIIHPMRGLVPENDKILDVLGVTEDIRMELFPCRTSQIKFMPMPRNGILKLLSPSRVSFSKSVTANYLTSQDMKGTDVLLEGFARFCSEEGEAELHLIRKGNDVEQARAIISRNGLDNHVVWHEEMTTHQLYDLMTVSDIVCDQFNGSPLGLITLDAYSLGRPVMANFVANNLPGRLPEQLPGLPASTPEEIALQLARMASNPELLAKLGRQSRQYSEKYLAAEVMAQKLIDRCQAFLGNE